MQKLSVKPRKIRLKAPKTDDDIRFDEVRRLRNALIALARLDPRWMWWVEKNTRNDMKLRSRRLIVERQARLMLTRNYQFLGCRLQTGVIYSDLYFTDDGNLKMYL
jgi:hypothetical protein